MEIQTNNPFTENNPQMRRESVFTSGQEVDNRLFLTSEAEKSVIAVANWGMFLAVFGCVVAGIMILFSLSMLAVGDKALSFTMGVGGTFLKWTAFSYTLLGVIYIAACVFMFKFCSKVKNAIRFSRSQQDLSEGLLNLKYTFTLLGVMVIVGILLIVIMFSYLMPHAMSNGYY